MSETREIFRAELQALLVRLCVAYLDSDGLEAATDEFDEETLRLSLAARKESVT